MEKSIYLCCILHSREREKDLIPNKYWEITEIDWQQKLKK